MISLHVLVPLQPLNSTSQKSNLVNFNKNTYNLAKNNPRHIIFIQICPSSNAPDETGWDLGPFAAGPQCLHLEWTPPQATKCKETIWDYKLLCACAVRANSRPKDIKHTGQNPNPSAVSEGPGAKTGCQEQKQDVPQGALHSTTQRMGKPPQPPFQSDPWTHSYHRPM